MKRAVVLHGYRGNPYVNWYPWLAFKLRRKGFKTWAPKLPRASFPDGRRWTAKLLGRSDWDFKDCLVIGHSAGSVEILNLLSILPAGQKVDTAVLVSSFTPKEKWPALESLQFEPLDFSVIKKNARRIIFVHGQDDPVVPVEDAKYLASQLNAELVILPNGGHFNIFRNLRFWRFPQLVEILEQRNVL